MATQWNLEMGEKAFAEKLDAEDKLSSFRKLFAFPKRCAESGLYFAGNSLGLCPVTTLDTVVEEIDHWKSFGVEGHFEGMKLLILRNNNT